MSFWHRFLKPLADRFSEDTLNKVSIIFAIFGIFPCFLLCLSFPPLPIMLPAVSVFMGGTLFMFLVLKPMLEIKYGGFMHRSGKLYPFDEGEPKIPPPVKQ